MDSNAPARVSIAFHLDSITGCFGLGYNSVHQLLYSWQVIYPPAILPGEEDALIYVPIVDGLEMTPHTHRLAGL